MYTTALCDLVKPSVAQCDVLLWNDDVLAMHELLPLLRHTRLCQLDASH